MRHSSDSIRAVMRSLALMFPSKHVASRHVAFRLALSGSHYTGSGQWQHQQPATARPLHRSRSYSTTPKKTSDPLHILFCGSDGFSCASLEALHQEHVRNPDLIQSIDVVVRPGKAVGRGNKIIRDPPIRALANRLGLQIHERDTFTGWNMPPKTNLIIAVSFGLFVPPRLLCEAKYGGLNLHPSLLPDLRGPAPLHHTLLTQRRLTGVSLQTLDHKAFDHGVVLAQTSSDPSDPAALRIPLTCRTVSGLLALVTPVATHMLISGLRDGLHVPPLLPIPTPEKGDRAGANHPPLPLIHAPKITKRDRLLTPSLLFGNEDMLGYRQAAIGPLWFWSRDRRGDRKRIIVEDVREMVIPNDAPLLSDTTPMIVVREDHASIVSASHDIDRGSPPISPSPTTTTAPDTILPLTKRYLIPFEDEEDAQTSQQDNNNKNIGNDNDRRPWRRWNLVFRDPVVSSSSPCSASNSPSSPPAPPPLSSPDQTTDGELRLGNYRVLRLKVEGERSKPAREALRNFFI